MKIRRARRSGAKIGRPPGSTAEDTVARLLDAGRVHFGDRGYAAARLTDIAQAAGITHSSIYLYFASKQELYRAVLEAAQAELLPHYVAALAAEKTLKGKTKAFFRVSAQAHEQRPTVAAFLAAVPIELRRHPELKSTVEGRGSPLLDALYEMFEQARRRGEIPRVTGNEDLLTAFIGSAMGMSLLSHGLELGSMNAAVEILLRTLDGDFFRK